MLYLVLPLQLLLADELIENVADAVHLVFAAQIERHIPGVPSGTNQGDHRSGDSIKPALVRGKKLVEEVSVLTPSRKVLAKRRNADGERAPSVLEGLKECFVRCVLKSAYASLLIAGECKDVGCCCDVVIGVLEI